MPQLGTCEQPSVGVEGVMRIDRSEHGELISGGFEGGSNGVDGLLPSEASNLACLYGRVKRKWRKPL